MKIDFGSEILDFGFKNSNPKSAIQNPKLFRSSFLILLITFLVFVPTFFFGFVRYDDVDNIYRNPALNPPTWGKIMEMWEHPYMWMYIPSTYTAWGGIAAVSYQPEGLNPLLFHAANVGLHAFAAMLVFLILREMNFGSVAAMFGGLVFAVHPVQVEAVAWTTGFKDVFSGVLALAALYLYLKNHKAFATVIFVLALLAKPSTVVIPAIALIIDWWMGRDLRKSIRWLGVWLALAVGALVIARLVQPPPRMHVPLYARPLIAGDALAFYIVHVIAPVQLAIDYGRSPNWLLQQPIAWINWLVPVVLGWAIWARWRKIWPGFAIFVIGVLPVLGLATFDFQQHSTVADRYLYLSMFGAAIIAAIVVQQFGSRSLIAAFILAYGVISLGHIWVWRNSQSLFEQTLAINPQSDIANNGMGIILADEAIAQHNTKLRDNAIDHFQRAIQTNPYNPAAHYNLGTALVLADRDAEAAAQFQTTLDLDPTMKSAAENLRIMHDRGMIH